MTSYDDANLRKKLQKSGGYGTLKGWK